MRAVRRLLAEVRPHVGDERVLAALAEVPRDAFVAGAKAWENQALPIGCEQTISQPLVVARMCALLELRGSERVLDVGTGSGYHAAILSRLAAGVVSIERHEELARPAAARLRAYGVECLLGDGTRGVPQHAPFDAINVAAAVEEVPPALLDQLAPGGRLVLPLGGDEQRLVLVRRTPEGFTHEAHERVRFVPLISGS